MTYDQSSGRVTHYLNGDPLSGRPQLDNKYTDSFLRFQDTPSRLGSAQLGNWHTPRDEIRNLNGRMDFFALWARPLSSEEIKAAYALGQPRP